jgi:hypothetical protein
VHGNGSEADAIAVRPVCMMFYICVSYIYYCLHIFDVSSSPPARLYTCASDLNRVWNHIVIRMAFLHKYRNHKFRPDIELGSRTRTRSAGIYEEVRLGSSADDVEKAQHHDLSRHKDAFGRAPDMRQVIVNEHDTTADG